MKINYWKLLLFILFTITQSNGQHYNMPEPYLQKKVIIRNKTFRLSKEQIASANEDLIPYFYSNSDDFEALLDQEKDSNGVMLHENKYKPTFIFQSGMNAYRYYKKYGDQTARQYFINQVEWLRTNFHIFKEYGL